MSDSSCFRKGAIFGKCALAVLEFYDFSAIKSFFSRSVAEYVFLPEMIQFLLCAGPRIREEGLPRKEDDTWKMILYLLC